MREWETRRVVYKDLMKRVRHQPPIPESNMHHNTFMNDLKLYYRSIE